MNDPTQERGESSTLRSMLNAEEVDDVGSEVAGNSLRTTQETECAAATAGIATLEAAEEKTACSISGTASVLQVQNFGLKDHLQPTVVIGGNSVGQAGPPALVPGASRVYPAGFPTNFDPSHLEDMDHHDDDALDNVSSVARGIPAAQFTVQGCYDVDSTQIVPAMDELTIIPNADVECLETPSAACSRIVKARKVHESVPAVALEGCYIRKRYIIWLAIGLLVVVIIIVAVVVTRVPKGPAPTMADSSSSFWMPKSIKDFALGLPNYTQDTLRSDIRCCDERDDWFQSKLWAEGNPFRPMTAPGKAWKWLMTDHRLESRSFSDVRLRFALSTLYFATNGARWTNSTKWLTSEDVCTWFSEGIEIPAYDYITQCFERGFQQLLLSHNGLEGSLPPELALITNLRIVLMHSNSLHSKIPDVVWQSWLNVYTLQLHHNQLGGTLPTLLGSMTDLINLGINDNRISGTLPSNIGNLISLQDFSASNNALSGSIPTEMGRLRVLRAIDAANNSLIGPIPSYLGRLRKLQYFIVEGNGLSGEIPFELGRCKRMIVFDLRSNELTGSLPIAITRMRQLEKLILSNNSITGVLPKRLGSIDSLIDIDVSETQIGGGIPDSFGKLSQLTSLRLHDTEITGQVPPILCQAQAEGSGINMILVDCDRVHCSCRCTCFQP